MSRKSHGPVQHLHLERLEDRSLLSYSITDLGTLGGSASVAIAINNSGQVVGHSETALGETHAFLWEPAGGMSDLGTLGGVSSFAHAINSAGLVAGYSDDAGGSVRAFMWRPDSVMRDLGTLGGDSKAYGINDSGHVVGVASITGGSHAFLWTPTAGMKDLGTLGGTQSRARAINNAGIIVGSSSGPGFENHAFLARWNQRMRDLGTLGGNYGGAAAINESSQVAGQASTSTDAHVTFLWQGGVMSNLGTLPGQHASYALGINEAGDVVGDSGYPNSHAFLYRDGEMLALDDLVPAGSGWSFKKAQAINDVGQIVGFGINPAGQTHAYLLTPDADPIPPPFFAAVHNVPSETANQVVTAPTAMARVEMRIGYPADNVAQTKEVSAYISRGPGRRLHPAALTARMPSAPGDTFVTKFAEI